MIRTLDHPAEPEPSHDPKHPDPGTSDTPYPACNIDNDPPVQSMRFVDLPEQYLGQTVEKRLLPMQPDEVPDTWADVSSLHRDLGSSPGTSIEDGVARFVRWYREYRHKP